MNNQVDPIEKELFSDEAHEKAVQHTQEEHVPTQEDIEQESAVLEWRAPESVYHPKDRFWYSIAGAVTVLGAINAYLIDYQLFAVLILLGGTIVIATAHRKPDVVTYRLDWQGVTVRGVRHSYFEFESFWIIEKEKENILILNPVRTLQLELIIPLGEMVPEHVYRFMRYHLPDQPVPEPIAHKVMEYLGF